MLRPLYRCLLRLHPPGFRTRFADEILSIFEATSKTSERFRLFIDGILSLVRQWTLRPQFWQAGPLTSEQTVSEALPSFCSLDPFRPRASAVIHGSILTIALFVATCYAIRYSWIRVLHVHIPEAQFEQPEWRPASSGRRSSSASRPLSQMEAVQTPVATPTRSTSPMFRAQNPPIQGKEETPGIPQSNGEKANSQSQQTSLTTFAPASRAIAVPDAATEAMLDSETRHLVVEGAIKHLKRYYVDPVVAGKMATALRQHERNGDDDQATEGAIFAELLTDQMRQVSRDRHLEVLYNPIATSVHETGPTPELLARYQKDMERTNCTFEKVAVLANNIGYVKLNSFPDLSICQATAAAAMKSLNETDAVIFDLRDNRGGLPAMVAFMESYLFNHPTHLVDLYDRAEHSTLQSWTLSPVFGNHLADKPAYVLTSSSTFSGAEEFSYDLKMLERATLVGETTAGGAHMVRPRRIDAHFTIRVPDTTPINPISKTNWEGTGVRPDVNVRAEDALSTAERLAVSKLQPK